MRVYYDRDCDVNLIKDKKVAILGYGSQGHAHALNLRDSGAKNVVVALRDGSPLGQEGRRRRPQGHGHRRGRRLGDLIMFTMPDELQAETYKKYVHDNLREGAAIAFAHGLNVHFGLIEPKPGVDVIMMAPEGPRPHRARRIRQGRRRALPGRRPPGRHRQGDGNRPVLLLGHRRRPLGHHRDQLPQECETDLFGEQAVLCGGLVELIRMGFETLVEAGYEPEMAYFECLHEVKLIVDLIYEGGIANMNYSISQHRRIRRIRLAARASCPMTRPRPG